MIVLPLESARQSRMSYRVRASVVFILCSLAFFSWINPSAQPTNQTQNPAFTMQTNVNRVLVPVVVRDKQGRSVDQLKKDDFQVLDNDKPRIVTGFTVERRGAVEGAQQAAGAATPASAPQTQAGKRRFVVLLFDDMHMSAAELVPAKKAGTEAINGALSDTDVAAVVTSSGKTNSGLIQDRAKLRDTIAGLQSNEVSPSGAADCPNINYYQADLIENKHDSAAITDAMGQVYKCDPSLGPQSDNVAESVMRSSVRRALMIGNQSSQATLAAIQEYVRRMANLPGQRLLILVSPGFLAISPEASSEESRVIDLAAQSGVTISALNARGLFTTDVTASDETRGRAIGEMSALRRGSLSGDEAALASLADGTGGRFFHNSNDLGEEFQGLTAVPECVYVLEVALDGVKPDGTFHRLKVKVDRADLEVQARRGYLVPKPEKIKK
jgi:VWFA-related protein